MTGVQVLSLFLKRPHLFERFFDEVYCKCWQMDSYNDVHRWHSMESRFFDLTFKCSYRN